MEILFLGTGTSHGIPMIGCHCDVCRSHDPRNHRTRSSVLVRENGRNILIDTATELRLQMLAHDIDRVDSVLYTHFHADHVFGFDDLRRFNHIQNDIIPVYGSKETIAELRESFAYAFRETQMGGGKPQVDTFVVDGPFELFGTTVVPIPVFHGELSVYGYRLGDFAYVTDCSRIPDESRKLLNDLDVLVLGALRFRPHPTHFNLDQALAEIRRIRPRRAYLTHVCHAFDHSTVDSQLPDGVHLAYDGLRLEL